MHALYSNTRVCDSLRARAPVCMHIYSRIEYMNKGERKTTADYKPHADKEYVTRSFWLLSLSLSLVREHVFTSSLAQTHTYTRASTPDYLERFFSTRMYTICSCLLRLNSNWHGIEFFFRVDGDTACCWWKLFLEYFLNGIE